MSWSFVGSSAPNAASGVTSVVFNKPAGVLSGDFIVVALQGWGSGTITAAPSGFTTLVTGNDWNGGESFLLAYKIAGASEPGTYTVTASAGWWPAGYLYVIRSSTGLAYGQSATVKSTSRVTSQPAASLTGIAASSAVIYGYGGDNSSQSGSNTLVLPSPANLLSGSKTADQNNASGGSDYGILTCTGSGAPGGATSTGSIDYYNFAIEVTAASSVNADTAGVGATVSTTPGVGAVVAISNVKITGAGSTGLVTGGAGSVIADANTTGTGALIVLSSGEGTVTADAATTGHGASVSVADGTGTPHAGVSVTGTGALVTVESGDGTISTGQSGITAGVGAHVTVTNGTGSHPVGGVRINGAAALVTAHAGIGNPHAGSLLPASIAMQQTAPNVETQQVAASVITQQIASTVSATRNAATVSVVHSAATVAASNKTNGTVSLTNGI